MKPVVGSHTAVLSLQNGVIKDDILRRVLGAENLMGGVAYVGTAISRPGVIRQTGALQRLLSECDNRGVWSPKILKSAPKPINKITYHYYPLHLDAKTTEGKEVDITFRLAVIAKVLGWSLSYS